MNAMDWFWMVYKIDVVLLRIRAHIHRQLEQYLQPGRLRLDVLIQRFASQLEHYLICLLWLS